jgi:predicted PurR-regulated permease PerM
MNQPILQKMVFVFFVVLLCIAIYLLGHLIAPFIAVILLGIIAAGAFKPLYKVFLQKLSPVLSSLSTCLLIFFIIFIPFIFFLGILSRETFDLYTMAKNAVLSSQLKNILENTNALDLLNQFFAGVGIEIVVTWDELISPLSELGKTLGFTLFQQARFITSNVVGLIFYFGLMMIVVFYMLIDGERFIQYLYDLSPLPEEYDKKIYDKFMGMAGAIMIGNGICGFIEGAAGGILFWVLGLDSPFLWGVIMAFMAFLPIVGIAVILVPTAVILMLKGQIMTGIFVVIFYAVLSWGVEYLLKPKIVSNRVSMHPLIVFFSIISGLRVYGFMGIIYGPLIATFFLTLADIYFLNFKAMVEQQKDNKQL